MLVAGQNDTGGLGRASGQSAASKLNSGGFFGLNNMSIASMMSCTDFLVIAQFTRVILGEQHGQVATALADLPHVDRRAGSHAVGESELECRHPFERRTVFVHADLGIVLVQQGIAESDDGRQHVVQPVCRSRA